MLRRNGKSAATAKMPFALSSQEKWLAAHTYEAPSKMKFVLVESLPQRKKDPIVFDTDEHPRLSSLETLSGLKPAFRENGTVTAGNSSGINDGAACALVVSEDILKRYNLIPMARIVGFGVAGVDPAYMGIGPIPATQKALNKAGLNIKDMDVMELNEAFAAQVLASMDELKADPNKINLNGGSIAIGHPLGASGTRISATLLHQFKQNKSLKYGLATMCIGVGQGSAVIFENLNR